MIDLTPHPAQIEANARRAARQGIVLPTFEQMIDPSKIPAETQAALRNVGLWDVDPLNLFRVTWKNEPAADGGGFGGVNVLEFPPEVTGVPARIIGISGKWFPTGAHKVGAATACLAPRLVTGQFNPDAQKAVWPSTGNYCRGGAYISALLGCESIAILPEEMSQERFEWLKTVAGEVIPTPGCESNVKEIYDKCWELRRTRGDDVRIFNQFEEFGNYLWHHEVTGRALEEVFEGMKRPGDRAAMYLAATGSGGTLAAGDYLQRLYPHLKIAAGEALQCPTLLNNGFGGHRIEGIGDKHVPWIHNVRNTDMVVAVDDEDVLRAMEVFNEPLGRELLARRGAPAELLERIHWLGISCIGNLLGCIKAARYYEMDERDVILTVFTDSMELYGSRMKERRAERGEYTDVLAATDFERGLLGQHVGNVLELTYPERKRVHNLKYYTWIEQQQRDLDELNAQWYDSEYWQGIPALRGELDRLIQEFNRLAAREAAQTARSG